MKQLLATFILLDAILTLACGSGPKPVHYGPRVTTPPTTASTTTNSVSNLPQPVTNPTGK
jgi:hypothetical protein